MLLAFVLSGIQPLPPIDMAALESRPTMEVAVPVAARGRATVRIVRAFRLEAGDNSAIEGAQRRSTDIVSGDGVTTPADLVEFE